jgi:2-oxoglutarate ferredoxin oxidoreductase subunit gamma
MEFSSIFAGFGGQGLLFCGNVLAQAAVLEGREVSWMPSYGPEMRGGTASCTVIIADRPIGSPMVDAPDAVVVLNPPSLAKFEPIIVPEGLLVMNATLIEAEAARDDIEILSMPCTQIARDAGDDRLVSIVALGGMLARRPIVNHESVYQAIREILSGKKAHMIEADLSAFEHGYEVGLREARITAEVAR